MRDALDRRGFLHGVLAAGGGALLAPLVRAESHGMPSAADSCILILLSGGVAQTDTWDPKEFTPFQRGMPARDLLGTCPSIPTAIPGVRFGAGLEEIAAVMDRGCVVRSLVVERELGEGRAGRLTHRGARRSMLQAMGMERQGSPSQARHSTREVPFNAQLERALRLASDGPCTQLVEFPFEPFGGFDTHEHGARHVAALKRMIDEPIARFVRGLDVRGVLDRTLVVVASEFGRTIGPARGGAAPGSPARGQEADGSVTTPTDLLALGTIEDEAQYGFHAHFDGCTSALLFGAGTPRGTVHGRSSEQHPMIAVADPVPWSSWCAMLRSRRLPVA
jgi:hypothetical protein